MLKSLSSAALLLCAVTPIMPLHAEEQLPKTHVPYSDLALQTPAGRAMLDSRLHGAARRVCPPGDTQSLKEKMAVRRCVREALSNARLKAAFVIAQAQRPSATDKLASR